jgi:outer membrane usher protein
LEPSPVGAVATVADAGDPRGDPPRDTSAADALPDGGETAPSPKPPTEPPAEEDKPAFLHATVNQIDVGDAFVVMRGQDILIRVADLEKSGMHTDGGKREKHGEDTLVSLRSLAPKVAFVFDEMNLALNISADASFFGALALDLRNKRPEGIIYATAPSLFVNYQVGALDLQSQGSTHLGAFSEAGFSLRGALLYNSAKYDSRPAQSYGRLFVDSTWVRMMTNLTFDWKSRLTRIVGGDTPASGDQLGGGAILGGIGVSRSFALDPYFSFLPTMQLSGTAMTPSTVEVYVNGQLIRRETLPPGQFNLKNVPLTNGSGETRVVVRDAFGGQQTMVSPYYLALGTLSKGLSDFSYNAGFVRQGFGTESWNYGQPAFVFRHRQGMTDWFTLGGRAEGTPTMVSGGASAAFRSPIGELGAAVAASRQNRDSGGAALLSYSYVGKPVLFQLGMRYQSDRYATLSLAPQSDRQRTDITSTVAAMLGNVGSLSLQYRHMDMRDSGWNEDITLRWSRSFARRIYLYAEYGNGFSRSFPVEYRTFVGLSYSVAERTTAAASHADRWGGQNGRGENSQATVQHSLPVGAGYGYRVTVAQGDNVLNDAIAQYQGSHGRVEAEYQREGFGAGNRGHASVSATGGLVVMGGRAFLTRPVQDSFAMIRVPGVEGVHGLMSNQVVGTTDRKGDLLIPSLLSYYGNRIGIDDRDIPLDHEIGTTELTIAPPYRGGAIVSFPVRRVLAVAGTVVVEEGGKETAPAYGQIGVTIGDREMTSPFDEAGNFYLENVPPGSYTAEVQYATGVCTFQLVVKASGTSLAQVGTVRCIVKQKESE